MNDGQLLLKAILANPDDDTARLVYADWLEENGVGARAEFIRVQCERARLCGPKPMPDIGKAIREAMELDPISIAALQDRERELRPGGFMPPPFMDELQTLNRLLWRAPVAGTSIPGGMFSGELRRGFVESVTCAAEDWLSFADAIRAAHPVRSVTFTTMPSREALWALGISDPPLTREKVKTALQRRWDGIEFTLKPPMSGSGGSITVGGQIVPIGSWQLTPETNAGS